MSRSDFDQELSFDDLRRLLIEKRRSIRKARIAEYQKSGELRAGADMIDASGKPGVRITYEKKATHQGNEKKQTPVKRFWVDRFLFAIELIAVAGFIYILYNGTHIIRNLNEDVSSSLVLPSLTPTALISAVVLPSGHTPPNSPDGVQPNEAEIPEHLQPFVQSLASLPIPTPGPQQAVRIQIPSIDIDYPVVQGDGWEQLKKGVGQHIGTPNPGETGNIVLSAHNDIFGEIFRDLDQLKEGDQVILFTSTRTYTYIVDQTQIVEPTQTEVMAPSNDSIITLISCYPYMVDNQRIAVKAYLQE